MVSCMNEKDRRVTESFEQYGTVVIRNCYKFVRDYHEAEDLCQETFIKFSKNCTRVPEIKTLAWLLTVSTNLSLDCLKRSGRIHTVVGLPTPDPQELISDVDMVGMFVDQEDFRQHMLVLEQLRVERPDWYQVIVWSNVENLDNDTIGERMEKKPELISKWKGRARDWLRKRYEREYPDG